MDDTSTETRWRRIRVLLNLTLAAWIFALAFWLGPHEIIFGRLRGLSVDDLVPIASKWCVSQVREIKLYQRTHGQFPQTAQDLGPVFDWNVQSSNCPQRGPGLPEVYPNRYVYSLFTHYNESIEYDFTPGKEGWSVRGYFLTASLPLPPVQLELSTQP
jgi:hypothetical protein